MLPPRHRMRQSADFTDAVRGGARGGSRTVVVHLFEPTSPVDEPALVGLVVSGAVGNAVERTQVKRRLRGLMAPRLGDLEAGEKLVLRALPAACGASSGTLASDVDGALRAARRRRTRRAPAS